MTEEQQAQLLAQWLEDPSSPPPEGLDPEVIEALGVIRPDCVPIPRVTAEAILDAAATESPVVDLNRERAARIPGWQFIGGLSGAGAMAAAALALFALFPASSWKTTGTPEAMPEVALETAPITASTEPSAEPPALAAVPEEVDDEGSGALPVAEIAVASPSVEPSSPPPSIAATRAPEPSPQFAEMEDRAQVASGSAAMAPAPPPAPKGVMTGNSGRSFTPGAEEPAARAPARSRARPSAKRAVMADVAGEAEVAELAQDDDTVEPMALDTLRGKVLVHLGPMPEVHEGSAPEAVWLANAKSALDAGQHDLAEQHALHGLSLGSGPTAERRWLTFLVGEARRLRGDAQAARLRFEAALRGEVD